MSKVLKMTVYLVDPNSNYEEREEFIKPDIEESLEELGYITHIEDIQESAAFEWKDELQINRRDAVTEDYEEYFKK